ncbi:MAG: hypothetical protein M1598_06910 [Actinobacteria bacterium]|nr:hypothetical protein [Actinomycetota bacterium]
MEPDFLRSETVRQIEWLKSCQITEPGPEAGAMESAHYVLTGEVLARRSI